jgi:glycine betaine/proline transport system ATP-binding protein
LAREVNAGQSQLTQNHLVQEYLTTTSDRPLIDIADLVGKHVVPLAVVDDQRRLLGVVPRAAVLSALAANSKPQPAPATAAPALAKG